MLWDAKDSPGDQFLWNFVSQDYSQAIGLVMHTPLEWVWQWSQTRIQNIMMPTSATCLCTWKVLNLSQWPADLGFPSTALLPLEWTVCHAWCSRWGHPGAPWRNDVTEIIISDRLLQTYPTLSPVSLKFFPEFSFNFFLILFCLTCILIVSPGLNLTAIFA